MSPRKDSGNQSSLVPPARSLCLRLLPLPLQVPRAAAGSGRPPEENVAALLADVGPEPQELAVDPVQDGLEVLTLPGVLAIKEL